MPKPKTNHTSNRTLFRRIVGVLLGAGYTAIFYAFQFVIREIIRVFSAYDENVLWILNTEEVYFYNWFFAGVALIVGQSICLTYWFERPKQFLKNNIRKRTNILTDQRFMLANFLMWGLKLGVLYGMLFGILYTNYHVFFSLYPDYKIVFILVIIVLFFQSWNSIRRTYKRKSYKWMLLSFVSLTILSFLMAKVNVVDYKKANETLQKWNLYEANNLELPKVETYEHDLWDSGNSKITLFLDTTKEERIRLKMDDRFYPTGYNENGEFDISAGFGWCGNNNYNLLLCIDKKIAVKHVWSLLGECLSNNRHRIHYQVWPTRIKYNHFMRAGTIKAHYPSTLFDKHFGEYKKANYSGVINILHRKSGDYDLNGENVNRRQLEEKLYTQLLKKAEYLIDYQIDEDLPFQVYINFLQSFNKVRSRIWSIDTWEEYGIPYDDLEENQKQRFRKEYPIYINESFIAE